MATIRNAASRMNVLRFDRETLRSVRLRVLALAAGAITLGISSSCAHAATYTVASISELTQRISNAVPGDTIVVKDGEYRTTGPITITNTASKEKPILIKAETVGGAKIAGAAAFHLNAPAAFITIQGFDFTDAGSIVISNGTSHCRFTRNRVHLTIPARADVSYLMIFGDDVEVDHNEFFDKSTLGQMVDVRGVGSQVARRLWLHHNYFHDFRHPGGNGAETIRIGLSWLSLSTGNALIEYNLFVRCNGENEMICNKSSGNTYRFNTLLDSPGGELSQRHGNDCVFYGNYLRHTHGMRVFGDRHKIFSNYFEDNAIGLNMGNGDGDVYKGDKLTSHDRPDDNVAAFNTFMNNRIQYEMADRRHGLGSSNTVVADNLFVGGGDAARISRSSPYTGSWLGNFLWKTGPGDMPTNCFRIVDPKLKIDSMGIAHLQAGSPAIDSGMGSFAFVNMDMDGQPRDAHPDVGADEFSSAPIHARILSTNDVGPNAYGTLGGTQE